MTFAGAVLCTIDFDFVLLSIISRPAKSGRLFCCISQFNEVISEGPGFHVDLCSPHVVNIESVSV